MKYNRVCAYCGKKYYVCSDCIKSDSYSNSFCSLDCYKRNIMKNGSFDPIIIDDETVQVLMRGKLLDDRIVDIIGYNIELGKYDCYDGITRTNKDFKTFYISRNEMSEIGMEMKFLNENREKGVGR